LWRKAKGTANKMRYFFSCFWRAEKERTKRGKEERKEGKKRRKEGKKRRQKGKERRREGRGKEGGKREEEGQKEEALWGPFLFSVFETVYLLFNFFFGFHLSLVFWLPDLPTPPHMMCVHFESFIGFTVKHSSNVTIFPP
jgi:hypothetical protein